MVYTPYPYVKRRDAGGIRWTRPCPLLARRSSRALATAIHHYREGIAMPGIESFFAAGFFGAGVGATLVAGI